MAATVGDGPPAAGPGRGVRTPSVYGRVLGAQVLEHEDDDVIHTLRGGKVHRRAVAVEARGSRGAVRPAEGGQHEAARGLMKVTRSFDIRPP